MSIRFLKPKMQWRCKKLFTLEKVSDRQERVPGWNQKALSSATVLLGGTGGMNGEVCEGLVRKGIGVAHLVDFDIVSPSNLNRQKFLKRSLYKMKAPELCRILSRMGFMGTRLVAHICALQDVDLDSVKPDLIVCAVDNQKKGSRLTVCRICHKRGIPCVFVANSTDADYGYVFIQVPGEACWACAFKPEMRNDQDSSQPDRCPGVPATADILKTLSGLALYAVDTLLMNRQRDWNYRTVSLSRSYFGGGQTVQRRPDCPVCGTKG